MRKTTVVSLALLGILVSGAGCLSTSSDTQTEENTITPTPVTTEATPVTPVTTDAKVTPAATVTADTLGAKLTTASLVFTTKDKTANIAKMESASAIAKATELNVATEGDKVAISVIELSDVTKAADVKKEVEGQWALAKQYDAKISGEFVDSGSDTTIVSIIGKAEQADMVKKIKDALATK